MSGKSKPRRALLQKLLDLVERVGNKVPHPAVLFFLLIAAVALLSHVFHLLGTSVSYQRINPQTHQAEEVTTAVRSLLSADGARFIFTSVVPNFINFGPVGIILVAMIGVGLAEQSGLIGALIRQIVAVTPPGADAHHRHPRRAVEHCLRRGLRGPDPPGGGRLPQRRPAPAGRPGRGLLWRRRRVRR